MNGPLFDPSMNDLFVRKLKKELNPMLEIREADLHINDPAFARLAAEMMDAMVRANEERDPVTNRKRALRPHDG